MVVHGTTIRPEDPLLLKSVSAIDKNIALYDKAEYKHTKLFYKGVPFHLGTSVQMQHHADNFGGIRIIDEAAQEHEEIQVASMRKAKRIFLYGDQKQLRPTAHVYKQKEDAPVSLMERLIALGCPVIKLAEQYRMIPPHW